MNRAPTFAGYTPADHERIHMGLHVERPADAPTVLRIAITANLVATNAPTLKRLVLDALTEGRTRIVLEVEHCADCDKRGMETLLSLTIWVRRKGGALEITNARDDLRALFRVHGIDALLNLVPSEGTP
jgi:anti-anti-sigma regulatory factor